MPASDGLLMMMMVMMMILLRVVHISDYSNAIMMGV
jgi:hypothetical protein